MADKKVLWILADNRTGSVAQARGIAQQLDTERYDVIEKKLDYTKLSGLPNFVRADTLVGLSTASKASIKAPWPDLVMSVSRRTVPVARYIKKKNPATKLIQLMHPGSIGLTEFSLVLLPEHDKDKPFLPNFRYLIGAPHRVTSAVLEEQKNEWMPSFDNLPKPLTAVVIGGAIKKRPFTLQNAAELAEKIVAFHKKVGGSLLVTTSRRTGAEAQDLIMSALKDIPAYKFVWGDTGQNPYLGYLACADYLLVTGDSVSMCSEACGTGKPVFIFEGDNWLTKKHYHFVHTLYENNYAAPLDIKYLKFKPAKALNAAINAAAEIDKL